VWRVFVQAIVSAIGVVIVQIIACQAPEVGFRGTR
jgi:hypothetical protein